MAQYKLTDVRGSALDEHLYTDAEFQTIGKALANRLSATVYAREEGTANVIEIEPGIIEADPE